jgi:1-acyl-sn-glycerol-3-phosphate acyltransferase
MSDLTGLFLRTASPHYAAWIARRHLDGVWVRGLDETRALLAERPVILAATHTSWWDGQLLLVLFHQLGVPARFLIDAESVEKMGYLAKMGAIGIDRASTASSIAAMEEASAWLSGPGRALWIFPQGVLRPTHVRPLGLQRGVDLLARHSGAVVVPVALVPGWRLLHLPAWAISFGAPLPPGRDLMPRLEAALITEIEALDGFFDERRQEITLTPLIPSTVVPFEDRLGARIWLGFSRVFAALRRVIGL